MSISFQTAEERGKPGSSSYGDDTERRVVFQ
jgi:hypothetical protein